MARHPTPEHRSLVILGGGLCGLAAGAAWALHRPEESVLLLEKEPQTGGYVTTYRRKGFRFDTSQMMPDVSDLLGLLGVDVPLQRFAGYTMRVVLVDPASGEQRAIEIPAGHEAFRAMLLARHPSQADAIGRFLDHSRAMYEELQHLKVEPGCLDALGILARCPHIVALGNRTFAQYLARFGITEPEVIEIFNVFVEFSSLPRGEVHALVPVSAMHSLLDGAFRPVGDFAALPQAMQRRFEELGGEVRTRATVERLVVDDGAVRAVVLTSGEVFTADRVITTLDPQVALGQMVGWDVLQAADPAYAARARDARMTWSSFNINLGLDDDIDLEALGLRGGYNVLTTGVESFEALFEACARGEMGYRDDCFHVGVICPSLVSGQPPYLTIRVLPVPLGQWAEWRANDRERYRAEKEYWGAFFVDLVEQQMVPGLGRHVQFRDLATPATYARYSGSPTGSVYDMAPTPDNFGRTRLSMRTPIRGLVQPKFVHGILGALYGGVQAVDLLLGGEVLRGRAMLPRSALWNQDE